MGFKLNGTDLKLASALYSSWKASCCTSMMTSVYASEISWLASFPELFSSGSVLELFMNWCTYALTLNNLVQLEYLLRCKCQVTCGVSANSTDSFSGTLNVVLTFLWISSVASGVTSISVFGHVSSGMLRNFGPFHHILFPFSSVPDIPLVGRSAGFWCVRTWHHWVGLLESCIPPIWFATNGLKLQLSIRIHHSTFMLSLQNVSRFWSILRTLAMDRANLNPKTGPISLTRTYLHSGVTAWMCCGGYKYPVTVSDHW